MTTSKKILIGIIATIGGLILLGVIAAIGLNLYVNGKGDSSADAFNFKEFELVGLASEDTINQGNLQDYDLTVMNMWQTTCHYCIEEMPYLEELSKEYAGQVQFVGICTDATTPEKVEEANGIVQTSGATYAQMVPTGEMKTAADNIYAYPYTIIVDNQGNVVTTVSGAKDKDGWSKVIQETLNNQQK